MANPKLSKVRQPKLQLMLRQAHANLRVGKGSRIRRSHKPGRNITDVPGAAMGASLVATRADLVGAAGAPQSRAARMCHLGVRPAWSWSAPPAVRALTHR